MSDGAPQPLDLPGGDVVFYPAFFPAAEADRLLREILTTTTWRRSTGASVAAMAPASSWSDSTSYCRCSRSNPK